MSQEKNQPQYEFAPERVDVNINVMPASDTPFFTTHTVRRPTLEELKKREEKIVHEYKEVARNEEEVTVNEEAANVYLYDQIADAVKGYDLGDGADPQAQRAVTPELLALIPVSHKTAVVRGLYFASAKIETDPQMKGFRLGGVREIRVRQEIGPKGEFAVVHVLREPSEQERSKYRHNSQQYRQVRGSRQQRGKIVQKLTPAVELYDALLVRVEGGVVQGEHFEAANRDAFIAAIDPIWKRQVVDKLIASFEADLRD